MKIKTTLLLALAVVLVLVVSGLAVAAPAPSMSGDVVMAWGSTDVRAVSFKASGTLTDGDGWIRIKWGSGSYVEYEVTHFNRIDKKIGACWGTLHDTNVTGWGLDGIVIWAQDTYKGSKERMAWVWTSRDYDPAYLEGLYFPFDPPYPTTPDLSEPLSGHLKVK